jgi:hypothetical protein
MRREEGERSCKVQIFEELCRVDVKRGRKKMGERSSKCDTQNQGIFSHQNYFYQKIIIKFEGNCLDLSKMLW